MAKLPKDFDAYSFQKLCKDILVIKFPSLKFEEYGRNGQKQDGIDLISLPWSDLTPRKVAQCKFYGGTERKAYGEFLKQIKEDFDAACNSKDFNFKEYIILTSLYRDIKTQNEIFKLSSREHPIYTYYWDDIESIALKHETILKYHFPYIFNSTDFDLFEKEQKKYRKEIKALFSKYNMWGIIHFPTMNKCFDDIVFEHYDECVIYFNKITDWFRNSDEYISSALTDEVWRLFYMLDSYYTFLGRNCDVGIANKAVPKNISQDQINEFENFKQIIDEQFRTVFRMIE